MGKAAGKGGCDILCGACICITGFLLVGWFISFLFTSASACPLPSSFFLSSSRSKYIILYE